jgi:hypothetical protein
LPLTSHGCDCVAAANSALQGPIRQAWASPTLPTAPYAPLVPTNRPQVQEMPLLASCVLLDSSLLLPMPADVEKLQQATAQSCMLLSGLSLGLGFFSLLELCWL